MQFIKVEEKEFDEIYIQMQENFPLEERRDYQDAKAVLSNPDFNIFHIIMGQDKIGFISLWELNGFKFIEHFVIYSKYRKLGYGAKALSLARQKWGALVLESEPPITQMAIRRLAFYARNGFCQNPVKYFQPSYRKSGDEVELRLLSSPNMLKDCNLAIEEIYKKVYNK